MISSSPRLEMWSFPGFQTRQLHIWKLNFLEMRSAFWLGMVEWHVQWPKTWSTCVSGHVRMDENPKRGYLQYILNIGLYYQVYRDYMGLYDSNEALSGSLSTNQWNVSHFVLLLTWQVHGDLQASVRLKEKLVEMEAAKTSAEEREHTNYWHWHVVWEFVFQISVLPWLEVFLCELDSGVPQDESTFSGDFRGWWHIVKLYWNCKSSTFFSWNEQIFSHGGCSFKVVWYKKSLPIERLQDWAWRRGLARKTRPPWLAAMHVQDRTSLRNFGCERILQYRW